MIFLRSRGAVNTAHIQTPEINAPAVIDHAMYVYKFHAAQRRAIVEVICATFNVDARDVEALLSGKAKYRIENGTVFVNGPEEY